MKYKAQKGMMWKENGLWHKLELWDTENCACFWEEAYKQQTDLCYDKISVLKCTKLCFFHKEKRKSASKAVKELMFPSQFEACLSDESGKLLDLAISSKIESKKELLEELYGETIDSACSLDRKIVFYTKAFDPKMELLKRIVATSRKKKACKLNQIARNQGRVLWQYEKLKMLSKHAEEEDEILKEKMKRQRRKLSKQKKMFSDMHKCARFYGQHCACGKLVHLNILEDLKVSDTKVGSSQPLTSLTSQPSTSSTTQPLTSLRKKARKENEIIEDAYDWGEVTAPYTNEELPALGGNFEWESDCDAGF
tara:strand:+ start:345 stop:1271 length:927 start_codon:yes stop_codon:yes gene_type:complete